MEDQTLPGHFANSAQHTTDAFSTDDIANSDNTGRSLDGRTANEGVTTIDNDSKDSSASAESCERDLVESVTGMYRILDPAIEQSSSGLGQ